MYCTCRAVRPKQAVFKLFLMPTAGAPAAQVDELNLNAVEVDMKRELLRTLRG
jgi:hypothetical protein